MSKSNKFIDELLYNSEAQIFKTAIDEWTIEEYDEKCMEAGIKCICTQNVGKYCSVVNKVNGNKLIIGGVCISKFMSGSDELTNHLKASRYNYSKIKDGIGKRKCTKCTVIFVSDEKDNCADILCKHCQYNRPIKITCECCNVVFDDKYFNRDKTTCDDCKAKVYGNCDRCWATIRLDSGSLVCVGCKSYEVVKINCTICKFDFNDVYKNKWKSICHTCVLRTKRSCSCGQPIYGEEWKIVCSACYKHNKFTDGIK